MKTWDKQEDDYIDRINKMSWGLDFKDREPPSIIVEDPYYLTFKNGAVRMIGNEIHWTYKDKLIIDILKENQNL